MGEVVQIARPREVYPDEGLVVGLPAGGKKIWYVIGKANSVRATLERLPDPEQRRREDDELGRIRALRIEQLAALAVVGADLLTRAIALTGEACTLGAALAAARSQVENARRVGFVREIPA